MFLSFCINLDDIYIYIHIHTHFFKIIHASVMLSLLLIPFLRPSPELSGAGDRGVMGIFPALIDAQQLNLI